MRRCDSCRCAYTCLWGYVLNVCACVAHGCWISLWMRCLCPCRCQCRCRCRSPCSFLLYLSAVETYHVRFRLFSPRLVYMSYLFIASCVARCLFFLSYHLRFSSCCSAFSTFDMRIPLLPSYVVLYIS